MQGSILFHNLSEEELDLYVSILSLNRERFSLPDLLDKIGNDKRDMIIDLVTKGFLNKKDDIISLPSPKSLIKLVLNEEYRFRSNQVSKKGNLNYLVEVKNYLSTVQKQITYVETESRKAFLNLRTMVDKIVDQGKEHLNNAFERALDRNTETGEWVSIPHISPVGLYEPIEGLKSKFKVIIQELEKSLENLMLEYSDRVLERLETIDSGKLGTTDRGQKQQLVTSLKNKLDKEQKEVLLETRNFSDEVLISLNEQINLLESNLGKDLMEQFDAIERLNELKPERIWIMLEETRSELTMYLNNIYSRILREINTLQLKVDISKVSLILTNEAGKAIKNVEKIQKESFQNLKPLNEIIRKFEEL